MVRMSKPARRRHVSTKRPSLPGKKGPSVETRRQVHQNAIEGAVSSTAFIPKIS